MNLLRALLLPAFLLPLTLPAQVELLAGWNFGQFISAGAPSTDGAFGMPAGRIASNFSHTVSPTDADSGPKHIETATETAFEAGTGLLYFDGTHGADAWDTAGGTDIAVVERGSLVAVNHELVNGANFFPGDPNNAHLQLSSGTNSRVALTVATTGFSDYDPAATSQPNDANFTFSAYAASGGSATLVWSFNGVPVGSPVTALPGEFQAFSLNLPSDFYGKASSTLVLQVSGNVVLDHIQVNGLRATAVTFTDQPDSQMVTSGADVTFSIAVSGADSPVYRWRRDGEDLSDGPGISGADTAMLSLTGVTPARAGTYSVVVDNNGARAESDPAVLTVNVLPSIGEPPSPASANPGGSIVFEVVASGSPAPSYRWRRNGSDLADDARIGGSATAMLTLSDLTLADAGDYTVVVSNAAGSVESAAAVLTITELTVAPSIQQHPVSTTVKLGQEAVFRVNASGAPAPAFQWLFDGEPIDNGTGINGATTATLRVTPASLAAAGQYRVRVSNSAGSIESDPALLTVQAGPAIPEGSGPVGQTAVAGGSVTFTVSASGTPAPTYRWRKDGQDIEGETEATLTIDPVSAASAGDYTVVVTNSVGSVESDPATLVVHEPPQITTEPVSVVVGSGGDATFTVVATGNPAPTYQWRKNGEDIPDAIAATLTLEDVEASAAGDYTVVVTNSAGSDTSEPARLEVAVRVARVAGTQVFAPGSRIVLDSGFAAGAGYRFQWLRNGKLLVGATASTLLLENALAGNSGVYSVRVYAAGGRLLSAAAVATLKITVAGIYDALVRDPVSDDPVGRMQVTVTDKASFTGTLAHEDGKTYALKGVLALAENGYAGTATLTIKRKTPLLPLSGALELDARERSLAFALRQGEALVGAAAGEPRAASSAPVPWSGAYMLTLVPQPTGLPDQPSATAVLKSAIAAKGGAMKITGLLADATKVTASVPSSASADYAVWIALYSAKGRLGGDLRLVEATSGVYRADSASGGEFVWFRPVDPKSKVYPGGIDLLLAPDLARP